MLQPRDRGPPRDLAAYGGAPRAAHLREDRPLHAGRRGAVRPRTGPPRASAPGLAPRRASPPGNGQTYPCVTSARRRRLATSSEDHAGRKTMVATSNYVTSSDGTRI